MSEKVSLSPAQVRAVAAIMTTRTVTAAAAQAKVTTRTIYRWLADPAFSAAVAAAEADVLAVTTRAVLALTLSAVDTLKAAIDDPEAGHGVKVRAADLVLVHGPRLYELRTLEARLRTLEEEVLTHDGKGTA